VDRPAEHRVWSRANAQRGLVVGGEQHGTGKGPWAEGREQGLVPAQPGGDALEDSQQALSGLPRGGRRGAGAAAFEGLRERREIEVVGKRQVRRRGLSG